MLLCYENMNAQEKEIPENTNTIAFVSDTQSPMWIEKVFLRSDSNTKATELVFNDIVNTKPNALFILGDVVSLGYSESKWSTVDEYLYKVRGNGTPVYAVLGNHELMQRPAAGEKKFQIRFPDHRRTGYVEIVDSIAIILLNSNFSSMSREEITKQESWLKDTLVDLDSSGAIRAIIFGCHHPPYTNSKLVKSSEPVQKYFVEPYLASKKSKLFITGHSHAFEYFRKKDKDFIIIGGGGGLNHPMDTSSKKIENVNTEYHPHFHYLTVQIKTDELIVVSHELQGSPFKGFDEGYTIKIPLKEDSK